MKRGIVFFLVVSIISMFALFAVAEDQPIDTAVVASEAAVAPVQDSNPGMGMMGRGGPGMMGGHHKGKDGRGKDMRSECPMCRMMMKQMSYRDMIAMEDGAVLVMLENKLIKYDKDLAMIKEVELPIDMEKMKEKMMEMKEGCPMCKKMKGDCPRRKAMMMDQQSEPLAPQMPTEDTTLMAPSDPVMPTETAPVKEKDNSWWSR